jgi:hypothetical protein
MHHIYNFVICTRLHRKTDQHLETGNSSYRKWNISELFTLKIVVCKTHWTISQTNEMTRYHWHQLLSNGFEFAMPQNIFFFFVCVATHQLIEADGYSTLHTFRVNESFGWRNKEVGNRYTTLRFATATENTTSSVVIDRQTSRHGNC